MAIARRVVTVGVGIVMAGGRGKGEPDTETNHVGFRLVCNAADH